MHARIHAAHLAYRHAADLAPARPLAEPDAEPGTIDVDWTWVAESGERAAQFEGRHLAALGGTAIFLVAGALCGMWLQLG